MFKVVKVTIEFMVKLRNSDIIKLDGIISVVITKLYKEALDKWSKVIGDKFVMVPIHLKYYSFQYKQGHQFSY